MTPWNVLAFVMLPLSGVLLIIGWKLCSKAEGYLNEARDHFTDAGILTDQCRESLAQSVPKAYIALKVAEWRTAIAKVGTRDQDVELVVTDFEALLDPSFRPGQATPAPTTHDPEQES